MAALRRFRPRGSNFWSFFSIGGRKLSRRQSCYSTCGRRPHGDARPADAGVEAVQTARPGPRLVSKRGDWLLAEGSNLVGRERDCAVRIDSPSVSRHHARILVIQGEATVEDLGSKNGTYVN